MTGTGAGAGAGAGARAGTGAGTVLYYCTGSRGRCSVGSWGLTHPAGAAASTPGTTTRDFQETHGVWLHKARPNLGILNLGIRWHARAALAPQTALLQWHIKVRVVKALKVRLVSSIAARAAAASQAGDEGARAPSRAKDEEERGECGSQQPDGQRQSLDGRVVREGH